MEILRALVLGAVQGVTEFLPVSSSGHLLVAGKLLRWPDEGLAFDATLHLGTLLAVIVYFRKTWWSLLRGRSRRLLLFLVLGTIPGALAGYFGEPNLATQFRSVRAVAIFFLVTAVVLWLADRFAARRGALASPSPTGDCSQDLIMQRAFLIGVAQAFALIPGLSRSGMTIAAGVFLGLSRAHAVEFSFLLALPVTAAAGVAGLGQLVSLTPGQLVPAGVGLLVALGAGIAAIGLLLRTIRTRTFLPYVLYLLVAGALLLWV